MSNSGTDTARTKTWASGTFYMCSIILGVVCGDLLTRERYPRHDIDRDGVSIFSDNCPETTNNDQRDDDEDGIGNPCDNCPREFNPSQIDRDQDGFGVSCDVADNSFHEDGPGLRFKTLRSNDQDEDGVENDQDNCWQDFNPRPIELDQDGPSATIGPGVQPDSDGDGLGDACDPN